MKELTNNATTSLSDMTYIFSIDVLPLACVCTAPRHFFPRDSLINHPLRATASMDKIVKMLKFSPNRFKFHIISQPRPGEKAGFT